MGCLGVHFALASADVDLLRSQSSDTARLDRLVREIEPRYMREGSPWFAESDKAWDAIHRALTDGAIRYDNGEFPLSHVVLGGEQLYELDDYIMTLKTAWEVSRIHAALTDVTAGTFRAGYYEIDPADYGRKVDDDDLEYCWTWFDHVRGLYNRAADANRAVLFTASQ